MRKVERHEILDFVTYGERREAIREEALRHKEQRRVHVAGVLTFLFEDTVTVRYQILEMVRAERIVKEAEIQHELDTYNELLGGAGELGATLLIELDDPEVRAEKLRAWLELPKHLYAKLEDGTLIRASYDPRQVGRDRVSAVQFLKFATGGRTPVAIGSDHPLLTAETELSAAQRRALAEDLGAS